MKELRAVIDAALAAQAAGLPAALATVIAVQGSSYRRPGARMLILSGGEAVGGVSGGCLEADVIERARRVLRDGEPCVVTYDTTEEDDILTGVGLGCQGIVQILIEPLPATGGPLTGLDALLRERRAGVLATVCRVEGEPPAVVGERLLLSENGVDWTNIGDAALTDAVTSDAGAVLAVGRSRTERYRAAGGDVGVFLESLLPAPALLICGAGNDAQPLVQFAQGLGWHVTVADARPAFAVPARFPQADAVLLSTPDELPGRVTLDSRTAVVVMTHNYLRDRAWLGALLLSHANYFGVLGPLRRAECLRQDLRDDGVSGELVARLHGPVGLDIGANGPEQIALAIVAEIQAAFAGRSGGPLSRRRQPLSPSTETTVADDDRSSPLRRPACPL